MKGGNVLTNEQRAALEQVNGLVELVEAYRRLHRECLRMFVASSDAEDGAGRVSAPQPAWKAMGDAMDALPDSEKVAVMSTLPLEEIQGMEATADKMGLLAAGGRLS